MTETTKNLALLVETWRERANARGGEMEVAYDVCANELEAALRAFIPKKETT